MHIVRIQMNNPLAYEINVNIKQANMFVGIIKVDHPFGVLQVLNKLNYI